MASVHTAKRNEQKPGFYISEICKIFLMFGYNKVSALACKRAGNNYKPRPVIDGIYSSNALLPNNTATHFL